MSFELTGLSEKVAIVTGAGRMRSIGRPIAVELARAGCDVVITGTGRAPANYPADEQAAGWRDIESVAEEIRALGRRCIPVVSDIANADAVDALVTQTMNELGRVDIVVNNAGGSPPADSAEAPPKFTQRIVELNLLAPYYVAQRAHHHMVNQADGGSIINIGSVVANRPSPTTAAYGAAKAGLLQLSTTLAMEWAPTVRVNTITVGLILTEQAALFYGDGAERERIESEIPMGRFAMPSDVGDVAVWLASDLAGYITGAEIAAHGGGERPPFLGAD